MKTLFEMDLKDYDENAPRFERPSVRGIISREGKIALVHSLKYDYYKFPGGGCKKNEKHEENSWYCFSSNAIGTRHVNFSLRCYNSNNRRRA